MAEGSAAPLLVVSAASGCFSELASSCSAVRSLSVRRCWYDGAKEVHVSLNGAVGGCKVSVNCSVLAICCCPPSLAQAHSFQTAALSNSCRRCCSFCQIHGAMLGARMCVKLANEVFAILQELVMLLQLHGVPVTSTSQQSGKWDGAEPRNVVGRGLRQPAVHRQLQAQRPSGEGSPIAAEQEQLWLRDQRHQPSRRLAEQVPARAVNIQPFADSELSTATEVDMLDADVAGLGGVSSNPKAAVDVPSMVAAVTALLAEVCGDRSPDDLAASAQRYVRWLIESTSGSRQLHPVTARLNHAVDRSCSPAGPSDQPQQFTVQFTSQVCLPLPWVRCLQYVPFAHCRSCHGKLVERCVLLLQGRPCNADLHSVL